MTKHKWSGGAPDPNSPHRCKRIKRFGEQCAKYRMKGSDYCSTHGGRRARNDLRNAGVGIAHLPRFYRKQLTQTLLEAVRESLELDRSEQTSLEEELAIAREHSGQAVAIWSNLVARVEVQEAKVLPDDASDGECKRRADQLIALRQATLTAGMIMVEQFQQVSTIAQAMSRIDATAKDKVNVQAIQSVVHQCVRIMHEVCSSEPEYGMVAVKFEQLVQKHILIPRDGQGTNITPDMDVLGMDDCVPPAPT